MLYKCCQTGSKQQKDMLDLKKDFDMLNDVNRLRILCLLSEKNEICVCDIFESLKLPQNLVSYHLNKLKDAGFIKSKKQGTKVIYSQERKKIQGFQIKINQLLKK